MARSPTVRRIAACAAVCAVTVAALGPTGYRGAVASSVGGGALVAAVALGLVLTYRSSGVVNFANAATATYGAYVFMGLRRQGELFLPPLPNPLSLLEGLLHALGFSQVALPDWPTSLSFGAPLTFGAAFALSLVIAAMAGMLMHLLIFRPLRHAPPLAKTVASVGLLLVLQSVVVLRFSSQAVAVKPLFEKRPVHLLGTSFARDQLILAGLVVVVTVALWAAYRFTRFGLATRAAAEDEKGAVLIGLSPERLASANWVISAVLAAAVGILAATMNASIDPTTITLLIVPALGAALVGGLSSFGVTVARGVRDRRGSGAASVPRGHRVLVPTGGWCADARAQGGTAARSSSSSSCSSRGDRLPTRGARAQGRLPFRSRSHCRRREGRDRRARRGGGSARRGAVVAVGRHQLPRRCRDLPVTRRADRLRRPDLTRADGVCRDRRVRRVEAGHASWDRVPDRAASRCARGDGHRPHRSRTRSARARRQPCHRHVRGRGRRGEPPVQELGAVRRTRGCTGASASVPRHQVRAERCRAVR